METLWVDAHDVPMIVYPTFFSGRGVFATSGKFNLKRLIYRWIRSDREKKIWVGSFGDGGRWMRSSWKCRFSYDFFLHAPNLFNPPSVSRARESNRPWYFRGLRWVPSNTFPLCLPIHDQRGKKRFHSIIISKRRRKKNEKERRDKWMNKKEGKKWIEGSRNWGRKICCFNKAANLQSDVNFNILHSKVERRVIFNRSLFQAFSPSLVLCSPLA